MTAVEIWILSLFTIIIGILALFGITIFIAYLIDLIKRKYPSLDTNQLKIENLTKLSFAKYRFQLKVDNQNSEYKSWNEYFKYKSEYCFGILKPYYTVLNKSEIDEKVNFVKNNHLVKQWLEHINDYNKNLPTKIEQLKKYAYNQKLIAKNTEKEIIKGYIRDWSYVSTLIEHELKLDELNKDIQGLRLGFDNIKNQVNDLDNRLQNLENVSGWNCANTVAFAGGVVSLVPIIGTLGGAVATMTSSACAIAGV